MQCSAPNCKTISLDITFFRPILQIYGHDLQSLVIHTQLFMLMLCLPATVILNKKCA